MGSGSNADCAVVRIDKFIETAYLLFLKNNELASIARLNYTKPGFGIQCFESQK